MAQLRVITPMGFTRMTLMAATFSRALSLALLELTKNRALMYTTANKADGITLMVPPDLVEELPALLAQYGTLISDPMLPEEMTPDQLISEILIASREIGIAPGTISIEVKTELALFTISQDDTDNMLMARSDVATASTLQEVLEDYLVGLQARAVADTTTDA